jgi:hypothetical protein
MRRFEYASIHLRSYVGTAVYRTKESWFEGLEQSTVDAILATATESAPPGSMRLFSLPVLNVVGAAGWRVYQLELPANGRTWETCHLIREAGD